MPTYVHTVCIYMRRTNNVFVQDGALYSTFYSGGGIYTVQMIFVLYVQYYVFRIMRSQDHDVVLVRRTIDLG
jgi:hypothetical protein